MNADSAKKLIIECENELKSQYSRLEDIALFNQKVAIIGQKVAKNGMIYV